ncbi:unnamed protein product [Acidithrix sp. C25]|nr:unnamed protein product [Acidithrix sp. C25]
MLCIMIEWLQYACFMGANLHVSVAIDPSCYDMVATMVGV